MREHQRCPNCDSIDIEVVNTEWYADYVERVKICNDCPAQFIVNYGNPFIDDVELYE